MDDELTPTTRADLERVTAEMDARFRELNEKLELMRAEEMHRYVDLVERFREGQAELLRALHRCAPPAD